MASILPTASFSICRTPSRGRLKASPITLSVCSSGLAVQAVSQSAHPLLPLRKPLRLGRRSPLRTDGFTSALHDELDDFLVGCFSVNIRTSTHPRI